VFGDLHMLISWDGRGCSVCFQDVSVFRNVSGCFGMFRDVSGYFTHIELRSGCFGMFRDISKELIQ